VVAMPAATVAIRPTTTVPRFHGEWPWQVTDAPTDDRSTSVCHRRRPMNKPAVVGADGSEHSKRAVEWAAAAAPGPVRYN